MRVAFVTGALAAGLGAVGLAALGIWIVTVLSGSADAWSIAPWLLGAVAAVVAIATYVAERIAYRRTMVSGRSVGEPWAYRD